MTTAHEVEPVLPGSGQTPDAPAADGGLGGEVSRRRFVQGVAVAGTVVAAGATLAACSSTPAAGPGTTLAKTSDIPVGGGVIYANEHVVVTQPSAGTFKCFSSTCTH